MEIIKLRNLLEDEANQKKRLEEEIIILRSQLLQLNFEAEQVLYNFDPIWSICLS